MSLIEEKWQRTILSQDATIQQAIVSLNESSAQIVMVVNNKGALEGTISDGDIRRGILRGLTLQSSVLEVLMPHPLVVPDTLSREFVSQLMQANKIRQIPVVDEHNHAVGLYLWNDVNAITERPNTMVIIAGGMGARLRPHTENCPKPMLLVAGEPMLEHIIKRAKLEGFSRFVLAIHYLGHMIEDYFGDGSCMDVHIDYLKEEIPLGTAGALSLLNPRPEMPFIVTNGDVITDIRYGEMLDFHKRHAALATMAVRMHEWKNPFGVVKMKGVDIVGFEEKPVIRSHINAGVYALAPTALNNLDEGEHRDMPSLFEELQVQGGDIVAYPIHEPWLDVGRPDDLAKANSQ